MVALSVIEAKYVVLTLIVKETIVIRVLLIKIRLLDKNSQYAMIKVTISLEIEQIKANTIEQKGEVINTLSDTTLNMSLSALTLIFLKDNN